MTRLKKYTLVIEYEHGQDVELQCHNSTSDCTYRRYCVLGYVKALVQCMSGFKSVLATVYDDAWMMQKTMWMQGKSPLLMITRCGNAAM